MKKLVIAIKETRWIPLVSVLMLSSPFLLIQTRKNVHNRRKIKVMFIASICLYPLSLIVSIPVQLSWIMSFPVRLGIRYWQIDRFNKALQS
jgi:hypothetical protein